MNEMYVISVLMLYVLIVSIDAFMNTYRLLATNGTVDEKNFIYPSVSFNKRIRTYVAPMILRINLEKNHVLNKKCRPPNILVAH